MSTPCRIIVKINKLDVGKTEKFDCLWPALQIPYGEWIDRDHDGNIWRNEVSEKCACKKVKLKGEYIGIYCHWDGDTTGRTLKEHFKDYKRALNLVLGGFLSGVSTGTLRHYANRKGTEWKDIQPIQGDLDTIRKTIYGQFEYIFEDGKWKSKKC